MKLNKYKLKDSDQELLIYTLQEDLSMPLEDLNLELIEEHPNLEQNKFIPILKAEDLLTRLIGKQRRTRDTVLSEESIDSWNNLKAAYYAMKHDLIHFSKRIRDYITEKYSEIINNYDNISNSVLGISNNSDNSNNIHLED